MSEWDNYGFPDPTFCPVWKCAEGLVRAYYERSFAQQIPYVDWDERMAEIYNLDSIALMKKFYGYSYLYDTNFMFVFDQYFYGLRDTFHKITGEIYDIDTLLLDAADGDRTKVINLFSRGGDYMLSVEYMAEWLKQRKKALDLMVYKGNRLWWDNDWMDMDFYSWFESPNIVHEKPPIYTTHIQGDLSSVVWSRYNNGFETYSMLPCKIYVKPSSIVPLENIKYILPCEYSVNSDVGSVLPSIVPFSPGPVTLTADTSGVFWNDIGIIDKVWDRGFNDFDGSLRASHILLDFSQVFKFYDPHKT